MTPRPDPRNLIRVRLDVILEVPGEGVAPLEHTPLAEALFRGLRTLGIDVKDAFCARRKLTSCDERGRMVGADDGEDSA